MDSPAWVVVGRLLRTRGRVGEFIAQIDSPDPERAERLKTVLLRKPHQEKSFDVANVWYHGDRPILQFTGIDSISAAEPWEHSEILVPPEEKALPEEGAYLHEDLIGCVVEDRGKLIGTIEAIDEYGGPPVLRLKTPEGKELLVPFVKAMCKEINVQDKRIVAELPEGLLDL
ncbi:MAG: ribosome maturation factor RimM [Bryobacteraceae bacterium]